MRLPRWPSRAEGRRARRARFRVLFDATCDECTHPFPEHLADSDSVSAYTCSECVYELEHGSRGQPICHRPIPLDVLTRADAAAAMARQGAGELLRDRGHGRGDAEDRGELTIEALREAAAALQLGLLRPADVIYLAADLLATGHDGASLVDLASSYADATHADVFELCSTVLVEQGAGPLDRDGEEIPLLALRVACRRLLSGNWELRAFSSWVHDRIGHTGPDAAQPLVEFDDELDARSARGDDRLHLRAEQLAAAFLRKRV